jgi:hypothetical protein
LRSRVGGGTLVGTRHQSAQWDNFRAGFPIEAHDGRAGPVEISEHAYAAAKADALAYPKLALATAFQGLGHLVSLPLIWVEAYEPPILSVRKA